MISQRASNIAPFYAMEILEEAHLLEKEGKNIIHLEIGEPDFATPSKISDKAAEELKKGNTHYTHSLGTVELREAIAEFYYNKYKVKVDPDRILITNGTSPCFFLIFSALLESGDKVIMSNPSYPCYKNIIQFLGGTPHYINVFEESNFRLPIDELKRHLTPTIKALLINSPSNPTGTILDKKNLQEISTLGKLIISDEIYHGLTYDGDEHTILEFDSNAVVLNGFSKLYAMTGWRLGFMIVPQYLIRPIQKIQQNFFISANSFVQAAGVVALKDVDEDIEKMKQTYNTRRLLMLKRLKKIGFEIKSDPVGAFYIFVNIKNYSNNSLEFAKNILHKANVGVTPGIDFGSNGEGFLRFSYANSIDNINIAMDRLEEFFSKIDN